MFVVSPPTTARVPPLPLPPKFLVFMKITGLCSRMRACVGVISKILLTKELRGTFGG